MWEARWSTGQQCIGLRMERSWVLVLAGVNHVLEVLYSDRAWVLANCLIKLTECWEIRFTGPTSKPGGVERLLATLRYRNRSKASRAVSQLSLKELTTQRKRGRKLG